MDTIFIDDDAAGHGWSVGERRVVPDKVDHFSTVVHEFGHLLGLEDEEMDPTLAVGERVLPSVGSAELVAGFEELITVGSQAIEVNSA